GGSAVNIFETVATSGNTTSPNLIADVPYAGGQQFIYFKIIQANEDGPPDRAWTAPVWFDTSNPAPGQPVVPGPGLTEDFSKYVASKNSQIYHISPDCRSAKAIRDSNRITGAVAKEGRTQHVGCPLP